MFWELWCSLSGWGRTAPVINLTGKRERLDQAGRGRLWKSSQQSGHHRWLLWFQGLGCWGRGERMASWVATFFTVLELKAPWSIFHSFEMNKQLLSTWSHTGQFNPRCREIQWLAWGFAATSAQPWTRNQVSGLYIRCPLVGSLWLRNRSIERPRRFS